MPEINITSQVYDDDDDVEETLSLSDLPSNGANSIASDCDEFSSDVQDHDHQDFFEFFSSQDSTTTSTNLLPNNIIFCGKTITNKTTTYPKTTACTKKCADHNNIFSSKSNSFNKSPETITPKSYNTCKSMPIDRRATRSRKLVQDCDSWKQASMMKNNNCRNATKLSRWYYYNSFGILGRFPIEMDLSDMKAKQSKQARPRSPAPKKAKGLWRLLRVLLRKKGHGAT